MWRQNLLVTSVCFTALILLDEALMLFYFIKLYRENLRQDTLVVNRHNASLYAKSDSNESAPTLFFEYLMFDLDCIFFFRNNILFPYLSNVVS